MSGWQCVHMICVFVELRLAACTASLRWHAAPLGFKEAPVLS